MSELKKNKNAGFSLVEVLIAMAIFTICLVPLLRSFVVVSSTNSKSRQILNASTLAENIIEEIKSEGVTAYVGSSISPSSMKNIGGTDYPCYEVTYDNRSFDGKTYKLVVSLEPSDETYIADPTTGAEEPLNAQSTAELYTMSNRTDAFYVEDVNVLNSIAQDYVAAHPGSNVSDVKRNIETQYVFTVSDSGGIQTVEQTVSRDYNHVNLSSETATVFSSLQTGNQLKSLYIFYVPAASGGKEKFIIQNNDNYPLDVYIVQQKSHTYDPNKKAESITIVESVKTVENAPTTIRTNLGCSDFNNIYYQVTGLSTLHMGQPDAQKAFGFHELGVEENMDGKDARLYNITATVFDVNDNQLVSLTGTALR